MLYYSFMDAHIVILCYLILMPSPMACLCTWRQPARYAAMQLKGVCIMCSYEMKSGLFSFD